MNTVLILAGFHTMMGFAGSVRSFMKGSGLPESLETCYGKNTVKFMLPRKTIARAPIVDNFLLRQS